MRTPAKYWAVVAFLTAVVTGLDACAGRGVSPLPFAPSAPGLASATNDASLAEQPDAGKFRCYTHKAQPRWIFLGACGIARIKRAGSNLFLGEYAGYQVKVVLPRNDATRFSKVLLVNATGSADVRPFRKKAFPPIRNGFLYLQTVNHGKPIVFAKRATISILVTTDGAFGDNCGVAVRRATGWKTLGNVAEPTSNTLALKIPTGALDRIAKGPTYLAMFCKQPPAPTPTPTIQPSHGPTAPPTTSPTSPPPPPAYCSGYQTPAPGTVSAPNVPVRITDNSGLGAGSALYLYVTSGTQALAPNGQMTSPPNNTDVQPLPLVCYPGSHGGTGNTFQLPGNISGRLYLAYGPTPSGPDPSPNPMGSGLSINSTGGLVQPSEAQGSSAYVSSPWDVIELTLPNGVVDTTQENALGLPLQLTIGGTTVGVTSTGYQKIVNAFSSGTTPAIYKRLVVSTAFNGKTVVARIIAPGPNGQSWGFPQDLFFNQAYNPEPASQSGGLGYVGYVLNQYQSESFVYDLTPVNASYGYWCGTSDGTGHFIFTQVATPSCPQAASGATLKVSVKLLEAGAANSCESTVLSQPYGGFTVVSGQLTPSPPFTSVEQFYLWKALTTDLNRGTALSSSSHPVGGFQTSGTVQFPLFFKNNFYNVYSQILHANFINNQSYTISYDEPGAMAPTINASGATPIQIVVGQIPNTAPIPSPSATATPSPCNPLPYARRMAVKPLHRIRR